MRGCRPGLPGLLTLSLSGIMLQCPCNVCDSNLIRAIEQDDVGLACKSHGPPVAVRLSRPDADALCRTLRLLIVLLRSFIESRCVRLDLRRYITHPVEREQLPTDGTASNNIATTSKGAWTKYQARLVSLDWSQMPHQRLRAACVVHAGV